MKRKIVHVTASSLKFPIYLMSGIGQCWLPKLSSVDKDFVASRKATPNVHVMLPDPTVICPSFKCNPSVRSATTYAARKQYSSTNGCGTTLF